MTGSSSAYNERDRYLRNVLPHHRKNYIPDRHHRQQQAWAVFLVALGTFAEAQNHVHQLHCNAQLTVVRTSHLLQVGLSLMSRVELAIVVSLGAAAVGSVPLRLGRTCRGER